MFQRLLNAAKAISASLKGSTVPARSAYAARNYAPVDVPITPDLLTSIVTIHKVSSIMRQIAQLAFPGFDPIITAPEGEDEDVAKIRIAEAMRHWKMLDRKIGSIGRQKEAGTLELIRSTFLETATYKSALFEYRMDNVDGWYDPVEIQWIPSKTLHTAPVEISADERYIRDDLLKGIVYDTKERKTLFYQTVNHTEKVLLEEENCIYIEDNLVRGLSYVANIVPSIEQWRYMRRNLMYVAHEAGTPKQVIEIVPPGRDDIWEFNVDDLAKTAQEMLVKGPEENAFLLPAGLKMSYPSVPVPINPQEPDLYLKNEIRDHFFPKDLLEQTAQAISSTAQPLKVMLDMMVSTHRETCGRPWERFWTKWLEENGFVGYTFTFGWWDLTPKDTIALRAQDRADVIAGIMTRDEARKNQDLPALSSEQKIEIESTKNIRQPPTRVQQVPGGTENVQYEEAETEKT